MIADVLGGIETERTQKWGLSSLSVYGILKTYGTKRIIAMLHRLMESGLARQRSVEGEKHITVVELTIAGVSVMKGEAPPPGTLSDIIPAQRERSRASFSSDRRDTRRVLNSPSPDENFQADPEAMARFAKLRAARLELARSKGFPPYVICHDSVLRQIAMSMPTNLEALQRIKGMGPHKVEAYGQALLDAVRN
jgi:ATP-dependent DNA helicase RecQ